jgi:DNA polymerase III epsilon subunit
MNQSIHDITLTFFDTETTGLSPASGDRIIEIAAVKIKNNQRLGVFQSFINPHRPVSAGAYAVNRISDEMLQDAPELEEVLPRFFEFIKGSTLCSYNSCFDMGFLRNEAGLFPVRNFVQAVDEAEVIDVLKIARKVLPGISSHSLCYVARALDISQSQEHRALADVELTLQVFERLGGMLAEKEIVRAENYRVLFGGGSQGMKNRISRRAAQIQEAIDSGLKLKIRYLTGSQVKITVREVLPQEIIYEKTAVLLKGHCLLRNAERTFRLDNILELEVVGE